MYWLPCLLNPKTGRTVSRVMRNPRVSLPISKDCNFETFSVNFGNFE